MPKFSDQGYRRDLNLQETEQESEVLNNLGGAGISDDLQLIQNNARNTSRIGFCTISNGFFSGKNGITIKISEAKKDSVFDDRILIKLDPPHHVKDGHQVEIKNITGIGNTFFNGFRYVSRIINDGEEYEIIIPDGFELPTDFDPIVGASSTVRILPKDEFVFTNDDVVGLSADIRFTGVGATTLTAGRDYYVCESDGFSDFKLSYFPSDYDSTTDGSGGTQVGIDVINVNGLHSSSQQFFTFIRKNPVEQENIINFIEPERDAESEGSFRFFRTQENDDVSGTLNETLAGVSTIHDNVRSELSKKYEKTEDISSNKDVKFQGSVIVDDPDGFNNTSNNVDPELSPKTPGVFIGGTRAFSADNNPWTDEDPDTSNALVTKSEQISIGELVFESNIKIDGLGNDIQTLPAGLNKKADNYTHKIPVVINGETYFLLMVTEDSIPD